MCFGRLEGPEAARGRRDSEVDLGVFVLLGLDIGMVRHVRYSLPYLRIALLPQMEIDE